MIHTDETKKKLSDIRRGEWKPIQGVFEDGWLDKVHASHVWDKRQVSIKLGKHAAGRTLDGKIWDQFPEV